MKTSHERICKWNFHAASKSQAVPKHRWSAYLSASRLQSSPLEFLEWKSRTAHCWRNPLLARTGTQDGRSIFDRDHTKGPFADDDSRFQRQPFFPMPPHNRARSKLAGIFSSKKLQATGITQYNNFVACNNTGCFSIGEKRTRPRCLAQNFESFTPELKCEINFIPVSNWFLQFEYLITTFINKLTWNFISYNIVPTVFFPTKNHNHRSFVEFVIEIEIRYFSDYRTDKSTDINCHTILTTLFVPRRFKERKHPHGTPTLHPRSRQQWERLTAPAWSKNPTRAT